MARWSGCQIRVTGEAEPFFDDDCDVQLEGDSLVVSYFDSEGPLVFVGSPSDGGTRFDLVCRSRPRRATLERSADGRSLEGRWTERELSGTLHIVLGEPD